MAGVAGEALKKNAWLIALVFVLLGLGIVMALRSEDTDSAEKQGINAAEAAVDRQSLAAKAQRVRQSQDEEVRSDIAAYERKIESNPDSKDVPTYLSNAGNLYMEKLKDYPKAVKCYARLIKEYPDWVNIDMVYIQVLTAYERMDDKDGVRWACRKMMDHFPKGSDYYIFAEEKLHGLY